MSPNNNLDSNLQQSQELNSRDYAHEDSKSEKRSNTSGNPLDDADLALRENEGNEPEKSPRSIIEK